MFIKITIEVIHLDHVNKFGKNPTSVLNWMWDCNKFNWRENLARKISNFISGGVKSATVKDMYGNVILEVNN